MMNFDIKKIPFSSYGSYNTISYLNLENIPEGLYLRNICGGDGKVGRLFRIELIYGDNPIPFEVLASPEVLKLKTSAGYVYFCISEQNLIRIYGEKVSLRLTMQTGTYDCAIPVTQGRWEINSYSEELRLMLIPITGMLKVNAPWKDVRNEYIIADFIPDEKTGKLEAAIEDYITVPKEKNFNQPFAECVEKVAASYNVWLRGIPEVSEKYNEAKKLAAYVIWSSVVNPRGNLSRPAIYMSKNSMTNIWNWDNCFNAMAVVEQDPKLALDQLMIFFDKQDESGLLPDFINDKYASWSCCKPPIHGWTLRWLMKRSDFFTKDVLKEIYAPLASWTDWWFRYRDYDNDGIPQYNHGNDSGWDNSTLFYKGVPVESPDLSSFLIIQMEVLSNLAHEIGRLKDAEMWEARAKATLTKMLDHFQQGNKLVAMLNGNHEIIDSKSLQQYLPILLGKRLPKHFLQTFVDDLKEENKFFTKFGIATESIDSKYYAPNGYWRGPIWAPSTMLIIDGLEKAGETEFAKNIAYNFCNMVAKSSFSENYNGLTGDEQCDTGFTMTASVFLVLAHNYNKDIESLAY